MQKKVGRPSKGGPGTLLQSRWSPEQLARLDNWRRKQPDLPSRTEAIRRIAEKIFEDEEAAEAEAAKKKGKRP